MPIEFPKVPKREVPANVPAPPYPQNTPVQNPHYTGDEPYFPPRPAKPDTNR